MPPKNSARLTEADRNRITLRLQEHICKALEMIAEEVVPSQNSIKKRSEKRPQRSKKRQKKTKKQTRKVKPKNAVTRRARK